MRNFTFAAALAGAAALLVIPTAAQAKSRHHNSGHSSRVSAYPQYGYGYGNYGAYGYGGYQPAYYYNGYQPYYGSQRYYGQPYYGYRAPRGHRRSNYGVSKHQRKHMRRNSRHH